MLDWDVKKLLLTFPASQQLKYIGTCIAGKTCFCFGKTDNTYGLMTGLWTPTIFYDYKVI